jgi:hypothetical protein
MLNVQLHDDDVAKINSLPPLHDRARQALLLLDGYGLASRDRAAFVTRMIEWAVRSAREKPSSAPSRRRRRPRAQRVPNVVGAHLACASRGMDV